MTPAAIRRETKRRNKQAAAARRRTARRRRQLTIAGLTTLVVLAAAAGTVWFFSSRGSKPTAAGPSCASASATPQASGSPSAGPSASGSASPSAAVSGLPKLPAGADPALATKPVVAPPSGDPTKLQVTTLIPGKGAVTQNGQTIEVSYVGVSFKDCKEFDSSWSRSQPFSLTLGQGQVIKGWDQGLVGVKVGSRVQLDIPADLAYGPGDSPTNGPLRFVVDVLSAK